MLGIFIILVFSLISFISTVALGWSITQAYSTTYATLLLIFLSCNILSCLLCMRLMFSRNERSELIEKVWQRKVIALWRLVMANRIPTTTNPADASRQVRVATISTPRSDNRDSCNPAFQQPEAPPSQNDTAPPPSYEEAMKLSPPTDKELQPHR